MLIPHWVNTYAPKSIKTKDLNLIQKHLDNLSNVGMSPSVVAEKVFEGIKEKRFYIFTHAEEHMPKIKKRMENILALGEPSLS